MHGHGKLSTRHVICEVGELLCHRLAKPKPQHADWVGPHLAAVELRGSGHGAPVGLPFITVQLTDPASGAARVLVRGSHGATGGHLVAALKQQVRLPWARRACRSVPSAGALHARTSIWRALPPR